MDSNQQPKAGDRFGAFVLLEPLGSGSFGAVWKAHHHLWKDHLAAVKLAHDSELARTLLAEGHVVHALQHPHIVRALDADPYHVPAYLVLEYVGGGDLRRRLADGPVDLDTAHTVFRQVLEALDFAHQQGILHRDVKPENVLLAETAPTDGVHVKLTDFGLGLVQQPAVQASILRSTLGTEQDRQLAGTLAYMAPEIRNGGAASPASDVYSAGVVFFELLTGRLPEGLDAIRDHCPELPEWVDTLFKGCYARRERRYGTARAVLEALAEGPLAAAERDHRADPDAARRPRNLAPEHGAGVRRAVLSAPPADSVYHVPPDERPQLSRGQREAAEDALQALARQADVASLRPRGASDFEPLPTPAPASAPLPAAPPAPAPPATPVLGQQLALDAVRYANLRDLLGEQLAAGDQSAAHHTVSELLQVTPDDLELLQIRDQLAATFSGEIRRLEGHIGTVWCVAAAPDGTRAITAGQDASVRVWDLASGRMTHRMQGHTGAVRSVVFSTDGRVALSGSEDGTLRLWDCASGECIRRMTGHNGPVRDVAISQDGLVGVSCSDDDTVRIWNLRFGQLLRKLEGHGSWLREGDVLSVALTPDGRRVLSGGRDCTLRLWDAASGVEIKRIKTKNDSITCVALTPDGHNAVVSSLHDSFALWHLDSGAELIRFRGHTDVVLAVALSPDGKRIVSGAADNTVRLWSVKTWRELYCFRGHRAPVNSVCFGGDGQTVLSSGTDETARVWQRPPTPKAGAADPGRAPAGGSGP